MFNYTPVALPALRAGDVTTDGVVESVTCTRTSTPDGISVTVTFEGGCTLTQEGTNPGYWAVLYVMFTEENQP